MLFFSTLLNPHLTQKKKNYLLKFLNADYCFKGYWTFWIRKVIKITNEESLKPLMKEFLRLEKWK